MCEYVKSISHLLSVCEFSPVCKNIVKLLFGVSQESYRNSKLESKSVPSVDE